MTDPASKPVATVIRLTGRYHTGDYCAEIVCTEALRENQPLYASSSPQGGAEPVAEHRCWLIELEVTPGGALYYAGSPPKWIEWSLKPRRRVIEQFVKDANDAIRFPTKEAAQSFLAMQMGLQTKKSQGDDCDVVSLLRMGLSAYKVTEHIFDYTPRASPAALVEQPSDHVVMHVEGPCGPMQLALDNLREHMRGWVIVNEHVRGSSGRQEVHAILEDQSRRFNAYARESRVVAAPQGEPVRSINGLGPIARECLATARAEGGRVTLTLKALERLLSEQRQIAALASQGAPE